MYTSGSSESTLAFWGGDRSGSRIDGIGSFANLVVVLIFVAE